jgi:hypothetical protein
VFITLAVAPILIVTGLGPHENRMIPPARTAATTAAELQLAAVPCPTTCVGCDVSTGPASTGTGTKRTPGSGVDVAELAAGTTLAPTTATQKQKQQQRKVIRRRIAQSVGRAD